MFNFTLVEKRGGLRLPFLNLLSLIFVLVLSPFVANASNNDGCTRTISNTTGCSKNTYVLYLKDKNNVSHYLSGSTATYQWIENPDGTVRIVGTGFTSSSCSGDLFTLDVLLGSPTTTTPSGSPKSNTCGSTGSTSDWIYYQTLSGTITSRLHGIFTMSIRGAAFQQGTNANITQMGYGASGWFNLKGGDCYYKTGDINVMLSSTCTERVIDCERDVKNTVGCANTPYVLWFKNKYNTQFHLAGDTSTYRYIKYTNGDVRFIAEGLTHSSLTNDTYKLDIVFSNATSTPPSGSPKAGNCGSIGSTSNWIYFQNTLGTITSSKHGTFVVQRQGPAFQQGMDANITQLGYGGSGWLYVTGGDGFISSGDINVMLSQTCDEPVPTCDGATHEYDPCIKTFAKGSANSSSTTINITTPIAEIEDILVEGIYKGGQPTYGNFTNGTTTVNWTSSNAHQITNVSGTTDKGYYKATLPAASSVTMYVGNNTSKMHGFIAQVRLKSEYCSDNYTTLSDERYYTYHNSNTSTFSLPATSTPKNITAVLPIVEMNNDSRIATFTLTAGSQTSSVTINTFDLGQSMTVQTLNLTDVPGNVTSATLTFDSPSSNGDSYISGSATVNWYMNCVAVCDGTTHEYDPCIKTFAKGSANTSSTTINITTPIAEIQDILVEGIYKGGQPTYGSFTNGTTTINWTSSDANQITNVSGTTDKGYYKATLPAASSVTMNVGNNTSKMHGFVAQVRLKSEYCSSNYTTLSDERYYTYHNSNTSTFSLPSTSTVKNITAVLPIVEMNNDSRIATFTLTAGSQTSSVTINTFDLGQSMTLQTLSLTDVPGNITSATLTFDSPSSNGDSYISGSASLNWYMSCVDETVNKISGYTYFDRNRDTIQSTGEEGQPNITVYLYEDLNNNGILEAAEALVPIDSLVTSSNGYYEFVVPFSCTPQYINQVTYTSGIDNPNNAVGAPGSTFASYTMDTDNYIVELDQTIPIGASYQIFLKTLESGAYAIISESTDGINFYHNTNIAITSSTKSGYTINASRNTKYIKFDKHAINNISGYNVYGSTSTNISDYAIYGIEYCGGSNSFIVNTNISTFPTNGSLTTDNIETASFTSGGNHDSLNNFGLNGPVFIDGYVFKDPNANGVKESGEPGQTGVKVYLYYDYNLNGIVDADEGTPIDSAISAANGYYSFSRLFGCMNQYIKQVTYSTGIVSPNNLIGVPGIDAAGYTNDNDNLIVELNGMIPSGSVYNIYLSEIESNAFAIISESTDGVNYYYNTNIAINSVNSEAYSITASRDIKYIKFDKHSINAISGLNIFGAVNTTVSDYNIHGITYCNALQNAYVINTNLNTYPSGTAQTTDNIEVASFTNYGEEDLDNNFGFNNEGGVGVYCGSLKITINHNKVAGNSDHSNFPVYFDITNSALKWIGDGGGMASEYGFDIQLVNQGGARLDIEIVDYNPTTGRIKFWGNVDLLKASENTILYLRHGNVDSAATNPSSPYTWNSDYKAVYHFENTDDATGNNNDADNYGASFNTGKFGKAANLDGSSDYLKVPYSSSLDITGKKLTMSTWVRLSSNPSDDAPFAVKGPTVNQEAYMFGVDGGTNPVKVNSRVTTNNGHYRDDNGSMPVSQWAFVHFVYDGNLSSGQKQVYVNGSLAYTATATGDIKQGSDDLFIGKRVYSDNRYLHAKLDELRISSNVSSAGWIETEFNNQDNPSTFYTVSIAVPCTDPLPVTWLTFDAQVQSESTNKLTWSTASEVNNDRFEIQRRWDNETEYTTIGSVRGAGNSTAISNYEYPDYFGTAKSQVVYYRLKQVDFDGASDYSIVRLIDLNKAVKEEMVVNVFPVPSNTNVSIQLKSTQRLSEMNFELRIMDISGKELTQEVTYNRNGNYINLDVSQLPTGVYMVELSNGIQSQVIRLLVDQIKN